MHCQEVSKKREWEDFVQSQRPTSFLQSIHFGEMNEQLGDTVIHLGVYENEKLLGGAQVFHVKARRASYFFIPYGPFLHWDNTQMVDCFFKKLHELAKTLRVDFIRIHPLQEKTQTNEHWYAQKGYINAPIHLVSDNFWVLDISATEEEIMKGMRKNTRNLIRRAIKDGVEVHSGLTQELKDQFFALYEQTASRHRFTPYSRKYIESQIDTFAKDDAVRIFVASHDGNPISAAVVMYYANQASYHHGASIQSKVPAAYLMQWEAIREAKRRNMESYNFWGIVENKPNHPWAGLSFFKKGFGGSHQVLLEAKDKPLSWRYPLIYLFETIRRIKRGL